MTEKTGGVIGIDFGTTNSAVAYVDEEGKPVVIPNPDGETMTPSIVFFGDQEVVVGRAAMWYGMEQPARAVSEIKREMANRKYAFPFRGIQLNAETVAALILKKLKQYAEKQVGPIAGAVIAVPFYYDDTRRKATQDAGRIAGLDVIDIVNEPVASALCYAFGRGQIGKKAATAAESDKDAGRPVLVYDLGGGTFDVAHVVYTSQQFRVVATDGDVRLGGTDWTRRLADFAAERFSQQWSADLRQDPITFHRLLRKCEEAKHELTDKESTTLRVSWNDKELELTVTRDQFEEMTADLLLRTETTTRDVLDEAGVSWDDLADIILVGGASRMPMVRKMLERTSGWLADAGLPPGLPAAEPVALGAAIHAEIVRGRSRGATRVLGRASLSGIEEINVNSHSLGIAIWDRKSGGHRTDVMIPRNTPLPHAVKRRFRTVVADQKGALVQILEGESPDPTGCVRIGKCLLDKLPPGLPAGSPVEVAYTYEANGRVHVRASDLVGGRFAEAEIFRSVGLGGREVKACREFVESVVVK